MSTVVSSTAADEGSSPPLIPPLPDDLALNVLARIPRCYHPTLSLVSKPINSLLSSPQLYTARSLLHCKQHFLYVSIRFPGNPFLQFFTLNQNPTKKPRNSLVAVRPIPSSGLVGSAFASLGHRIFVLGGSVNDILSSHVWSLDCRTHTWEPVTDMQVSREFAATRLVEDKHYVIDGCVFDTWAQCMGWMEVYDREWWKWSSSPIEIRDQWTHASAVIDGETHVMFDRGGVFYEARSGVWGVAEKRLDLVWRGRPCVIDGVLFGFDSAGKLRAYVVKEGVWKELKGLEKGLPRFSGVATMANLGGKLVVVWEGNWRGKWRGSGNGKEMEIWCAEIKVENGEGGELRGQIQWCDVVLKVPNPSCIMHCLAVAL